MNQNLEPAGARPPLPRNVKILGLASLLNDVASEMVFPLLPTFLLTVLSGKLFTLGVIEGAGDSIASLLKLWSGGWSDRAGRRKGFVVFGYSLPAVTRPLIGIIVLPWQLFALRVADRLGKGVRTAPRDALIADSTAPSIRGWAFGFHQALDHVGAAVGPLLASAFLWLWPGNLTSHLRLLFIVTLVPGLLVVLLVVFGLREAPPREEPRQRPRLTLRPFDRTFRLYLLALVVFTLG
ncbi:MAG TPA: MFS transporter, partial [Gemmataceae bacterium]|nr:MFS transporter [Gemmataceae bacterium]